MKLTIKTNEYEIAKLPFEVVAEITVYDADLDDLLNQIREVKDKGGE